ncbi:MAG: hypothetical protein CBE43_02050 [Rhodopirellula sp. TMED283]|nr:MAG: hypothetical protein CBE43_02050 [Rhodopirellula sp. TMED283]
MDIAKPIAIRGMASEVLFGRCHRMPLSISFRFGKTDQFALMSCFDSVVTEAAIRRHHRYSPHQEVRVWLDLYNLAWCVVCFCKNTIRAGLGNTRLNGARPDCITSSSGFRMLPAFV